MEKIVTFDQSQSLDDFGPTVEANNVRTPSRNGVVTFPAGKKPNDFKRKGGFMVRSEGVRICCDFNGLQRRTTSLGAFRAQKCPLAQLL